MKEKDEMRYYKFKGLRLPPEKEIKDETRYYEYKGLRFPIHVTAIIKRAVLVWSVMFLVLILSIYLFQYEMTNADIPCGFLAGLLFAYLLFVSSDSTS